MHAYEMHTYEIHAYEMNAYEIFKEVFPRRASLMGVYLYRSAYYCVR